MWRWVCGVQEYVKWVQRTGPFDIMIDGANVALWGENYEGGSFRPEKIRLMYETVAKENPEAKILLVRCKLYPSPSCFDPNG